MNNTNNNSQRKYALIAGFSLLAMTIAAIFANFYVFESLVVQEDAITTANNISAESGKFLLGIFAFAFIIILDFVVAWALYIFFKPVHQKLSLITAGLRIIYGVIFAFALLCLMNVLQILNGANLVVDTELSTQVMSFINAFSSTWDFGIIFFGLHLVLLGYLVFKSGYIHKLFGVLLIIAGLGYLVDIFGKFILPNYVIEIAMFTFIGELLFMLWLLIKGGKAR
ncbi:MAG: DUF4386 domain-containing protein [Candidatus Cloacimonadota bacterium]|nr:DUF4386 domain-containing protein [Candidatus Cloacimonadota bacterium]